VKQLNYYLMSYVFPCIPHTEYCILSYVSPFFPLLTAAVFPFAGHPCLRGSPRGLCAARRRIIARLCKTDALSSVFLYASRSPSPQDQSPLSDVTLALRARENPELFAELFERFFTPVYRFFFFRLRHREDAEDLTSLTFEKAFLGLKKFEERGVSFSAWLFTIAHHCLVDHFRRKRPSESLEDLAEKNREPATDFDLKDIDRKLLMEEVWEAVRTLPGKYQHLWALKLSSDLPHREIAEILGTTENNVNVMVHRSLATLKEKLVHRHSP